MISTRSFLEKDGLRDLSFLASRSCCRSPRSALCSARSSVSRRRDDSDFRVAAMTAVPSRLVAATRCEMQIFGGPYVWWETLDSDIERICSECAACVSQRAQPAPAPLHSWPWPEEPWSRLNVDFLGPLHNRYYLIIVDAHSKWIEVERVSTTSATVVIDSFRKLFARFGIPKKIVSDNGPPFSSAELGIYFKHNGIKHLPVAPYHPSSNGAAENAVRTIKRVLKKASLENVNDSTALSKFLFMYRNTEHSTTGREPAVAMFGRRLRGRLDLLRPDTGELVRDAQLAHEQRTAAVRPPLRQADIGDAVIMRDYSKLRQKWAEGVVVRRSGPVTYAIKTNDGHIHKRHIDQLLTKDVRKSRRSITGPTPNVNVNMESVELEPTQSTFLVDSPLNTSHESKGVDETTERHY